MSTPIPRRTGYETEIPSAEIDITAYAPLVKKLACMLMARLPASVELDDLIQVGVIGLMEAARQFDPSQGVLFETFASQRVRGAMLDELRREDHLPRQVRRQSRQIETATREVEQKLGRVPLESEIAEYMGLHLEEYQNMLGDCRGMMLLHFEDFTNDDGDTPSNSMANLVDEDSPNPFSTMADEQFRQALVDAIATLPERDQLVMSLYYEQELNLKEIGAVLSVSESRVSQLHSQAIVRIRSKLQEWL